MTMLKLATRVGRIQPSATLALTARAKALAAEGKDVIALTAGEPDFETPAAIRASAVEALNAKGAVDRYTPASGLPALRKAIAAKFKRDNGLEYTPEQVMANCGAKHSCFNLIGALVNEGDEVIIPAPYWVSYPEMVNFFGGKPIVIDTSSTGFVLTAEALKKALTPRTRLLIVNTPGNPTGAVWSREAQQALADVLKGTEVAVLSDEIYEKLVYEGEHVSFAALSQDAYQRTVTINGVAKAYAMTGWRIGFAGGPAALIKAIATVQSQSTSNPCSISQAASVAALTGTQDFLPVRAAAFQKRRDLVVSMLNQAAGLHCPTPEGAFYVYPSCAGLIGKKTPKGQEIKSDLDVAGYLLEAEGVAVVHGEAFGLSPHFRISYATSEAELTEACTRIQRACAALQ